MLRLELEARLRRVEVRLRGVMRIDVTGMHLLPLAGTVVREPTIGKLEGVDVLIRTAATVATIDVGEAERDEVRRRMGDGHAVKVVPFRVAKANPSRPESRGKVADVGLG